MEDDSSSENDGFDSGMDVTSSDTDENGVRHEMQQGNDNEGFVDDQLTSTTNPTQAPGPRDQQYDTDLPSLHTYLGTELEVVRGRTVLEDNAVLTLEILQHAELVLMPGQTLPLTAYDLPTVNMLRSCLQDDRTFGVPASWNNGRHRVVNNYGTTAELYEYLPEVGSSGFRAKAKARQRFKMLDFNFSSDTRWSARVQILPEVKLSDPLGCVKLQSLDRLRTSPTKQHKCKRADAAVTRWPAFVFEQYNVNRLIRDIKQTLSSLLLQGNKDSKHGEVPSRTVIPDDPSELSFWVAQNTPMSEEQRLLMLKMNSPIERLRWELKNLQQCYQELRCLYCSTVIGSSADMFSMSTEGPQGTYVNPGGYLHETVTLYKVNNVSSMGPPSTEFSWFPGYAWSICKCKHCNQHVGWKFKATKQDLKPLKFWGICRRSITYKVARPRDEDTDSQQLEF